MSISNIKACFKVLLLIKLNPKIFNNKNSEKVYSIIGKELIFNKLILLYNIYYTKDKSC